MLLPDFLIIVSNGSHLEEGSSCGSLQKLLQLGSSYFYVVDVHVDAVQVSCVQTKAMTLDHLKP